MAKAPVPLSLNANSITSSKQSSERPTKKPRKIIQTVSKPKSIWRSNAGKITINQEASIKNTHV
uniref:Uncharacterized protein n=1 Tax=Rhizophora mucronata TaxID=61149 RepID=A0A2P2JK64_RHIMU